VSRQVQFAATFSAQSLNFRSAISLRICRVQDINQSLVDDGLVEKEKIGGSNYYWSFPGKKDRETQIRYKALIETNAQLNQKLLEAEAKLADARRGREETEDGDRAKKLFKLAKLKTDMNSAQAEMETLKENDPQTLADLGKELKLVKEAAERWTDNIFACKIYLVSPIGLINTTSFLVIGVTTALSF